MNAEIIVETLERAAERCGGDPAPLVYARLFAEHPELEALFIRDSAHLVRGQMLQVAIESVLDFLGSQSYGASLIRIERVNHEGLGVPPEVFDMFFTVVMATFKDILGEDWTPEMETAWLELIAAIVHHSAQHSE